MIVLYTRSNTIISKLVRCAGPFNYSHVGILNGNQVLDAKGSISKSILQKIGLGRFVKHKRNHVDYVPLDVFLSHATVVKARWHSNVDIFRAEAMRGQPFDLTSALFQFLRLRFDAPNKQFCTELLLRSSSRTVSWAAPYSNPREVYLTSENLPPHAKQQLNDLGLNVKTYVNPEKLISISNLLSK
jgi:hypothetical protein